MTTVSPEPQRKGSIGSLIFCILLFCGLGMFALAFFVLAHDKTTAPLLVWLLNGLALGGLFYWLRQSKKQLPKRILFNVVAGMILVVSVASLALFKDPDKSLTEDDTASSVVDVSHTETDSPPASTASVHRLNESFKVGYTSYTVSGIHWKRRLGDAYFGKDADGRYLLVNITVKNEDKENRAIPPFHLEDEQGATYDESADRMYLGDKAIFLDDLNPGVQKSATLVFDVPPEHTYSLVVSGGYWSGDEARVSLN